MYRDARACRVRDLIVLCDSNCLIVSFRLRTQVLLYDFRAHVLREYESRALRVCSNAAVKEAERSRCGVWF